jgi:hypothetical protein
MVMLNSEAVLEKTRYELAIISVLNNPKISYLDDFCRSAARSTCFSNYTF